MSVERIAESDLTLIRNALEAQREAEATLRFVQAHIGRTYRITQGVTFRVDNGEITRPAEMTPNS